MKELSRLLIILSVLLHTNISNGQWLEKQSLNTTVLLEKIDKNGFSPYGTGFLVYNYDNTEEQIVITCAHLIRGKKTISLRVNPDSSFINRLSAQARKGVLFKNVLIEENSIRFIIDLTKTPVYIHPELDIAAFNIVVPILAIEPNSSPIKPVNFLFVPQSMIKKRADLSLGDEVYFIGFPLGYGTFKYVEPIVRSGSIAWLPKDENIFLIDAFSYGGNSGSPIFQKRIVDSQHGDLTLAASKLVGMIVGHQSIKLENMLNQPNPDELKFEAKDVDLNIGLARCVYTDDINYVIEKLKEKK